MSIDTANEKLKREAAACKGGAAATVQAVVEFLIENMDDELAALVDREEYTASEMGDYIVGKVFKNFIKRDGGSRMEAAAVPNDVIFGYATDYYHDTKEQIKKIISTAYSSARVSQAVSKSEKAEKKSDNREKYAQKQPKNAQIAAKSEQPKPAPVKKGKQQTEGQVSLFDLMGGLTNA